MNKLMQGIERFWKDEEGAETVEWVLIVSLLVAATVGLFATLGDQLEAVITQITTYLGTIVPSGT
ncbi:Flp family type IVb pilin [Halomonas sp. NO4]|uniref:Flp family type IVb pilin n=1 Tax=Halomonas sp. NO4 TaxID=2484813 RepID=UPI0013D8073C|nr:Flp family type IVb pilin [Halomonas sp. NO4]